MKAEDCRLLLCEGWSELFIRDVPLGSVLNADTAPSYPTVSSGSWLDNNQNYMIEPSIGDSTIYKLIPNNQKASELYMNKLPVQRGTIKQLLTTWNNRLRF